MSQVVSYVLEELVMHSFKLWMALLVTVFVLPVAADTASTGRADSHAPIGVMGEHIHKKGEWMVSYRYMRMSMQGNRLGTDDITPQEIATTQSNPFFGLPGQPQTLRVVPTQMTTEMHMLGMMYAPSDWLTIMVMSNYTEKEMDHLTFQGGAGTDVLGEFTTRSEGIGDTSVAGLFRLFGGANHRAHATVGVSLPTGEIKDEDEVLTPMGNRPTLRLPYPMQIGSGTYDPIIGLTYSGNSQNWGWGAQWRSVLRVENNSQGWSRGDEHNLTAWLNRLWTPNISTSIRMTGYDRGNLTGQDPLIVAPVQTADPDRQGATRLDMGLGLNLLGTGSLAGHRLAFEFSFPLDQDLDGPQLESDWMLTGGYQYAF